MERKIKSTIDEVFVLIKNHESEKNKTEFNKQIISCASKIMHDINFLNDFDIKQKRSILSSFNLFINNHINDFHISEYVKIYKKEKENEESSTSLNIFNPHFLESILSLFEKGEKICKFLELIFKPIMKISNELNFKIKYTKYFYCSFFKEVYLSNVSKIQYNIVNFRKYLIDKLKEKDNLTYLLKCMKNNENIKLDTLVFYDIKNAISLVTKVIDMHNDLDSLTENNSETYNELLIKYCNNLKFHYSTMSEFNTFTVTEYLNNLASYIKIDTLIINELFHDGEEVMNTLNREAIENNKSYIITYFNEKIRGFSKQFNLMLEDIKNGEFVIDTVLNSIFDMPIIDFVDFYYKIFNFDKELINLMCKGIMNQIIICLTNTEEKDIVYITLIYLLLKIFEDELMYNFTPNDANNDPENNEQVAKQTHKFHELLSESIKKISLEKIASYVITFSQNKIPDKISKEDKILSESLSKLRKHYEQNAITEIIRYIVYNIKNKDDFEDVFSKLLCRKILNNSIENIDILNLEYNICEISNLNTICLHKNRKILQSYMENKFLADEYNILFQDELLLSSNSCLKHSNKDYLNLKLFPDAISPIKSYEYKENLYSSKTFKEYLSRRKNNFHAYYTSKYDSKKLSWCEHMSTFELTYKIGKINIDFRVNYRQADILFLVQNEYYTLFEKLKSENKITLLKQDNLYFKQFMELDKNIKMNKFINLLIEKRIFKLESNQINHLIKIDLVVFNDNNNVRKNKKFDFYKLKTDTEADKALVPQPSKKKETSLVFFRSDYVQCSIVKICKLQKEQFIKEDDLFTKVNNRVKMRFDLDKPLFAKSLEKLVDQDYVEKKEISDNSFEYKYIP